ncbi:MAG: hypothetical protein IJT51_10195 [Bacteroidales bacterium]|nr:hypothetical protein [Bacteroidales bacterium]
MVLFRGKMCWHSLECLADGSILMECKDGACKLLEPDEMKEKDERDFEWRVGWVLVFDLDAMEMRI